MTIDQLKWLLQAVDARPVTNLDEADHKAAWLTKLVADIRELLARPADAA